MRRVILLITALLLIANVAHAWEPKTTRGKVFAYECQQVNNQHLGFTCVFDEGQLTLVRHERFDKMAPEKRKKAEYEFNRISLRYMELGGKTCTQRADFWPPNKARFCYRVHNSPSRIACDDITVKN